MTPDQGHEPQRTIWGSHRMPSLQSKCAPLLGGGIGIVDCFNCMPSTRSFSNLLYDIFCHVMYTIFATHTRHSPQPTAHTGKSFVSRYTQSWPRAGVSGYHATRAHGKHGRGVYLLAIRRYLERSAKPIYALPTAARGASPASRLAWHPRAARRPAPSARASAGPLSLAKARGERVGSASLRRSVAPRFEWRIGGSWIRMAVTHCSEG